MIAHTHLCQSLLTKKSKRTNFSKNFLHGANTYIPQAIIQVAIYKALGSKVWKLQYLLLLWAFHILKLWLNYSTGFPFHVQLYFLSHSTFRICYWFLTYIKIIKSISMHATPQWPYIFNFYCNYIVSYFIPYGTQDSIVYIKFPSDLQFRNGLKTWLGSAWWLFHVSKIMVWDQCWYLLFLFIFCLDWFTSLSSPSQKNMSSMAYFSLNKYSTHSALGLPEVTFNYEHRDLSITSTGKRINDDSEGQKDGAAWIMTVAWTDWKPEW